MPSSIETAEATGLAHTLGQLTGESVTEDVTPALRERLTRERDRRGIDDGLATRLTLLSRQLSAAYDTRPVGRDEWDAASGEAANIRV